MPRNATTPELDGEASEPLKAIGPGAGTTIPTIHLSLQGKGGVGKSLVASILAQYFLHHGVEVHCLDTDPVNQTFSQYSALGAEHLELMRDGKIDSRGFDALMERLKAARDKAADELGLDRGFLMPRSQLEELARGRPRSLDALREMPGIRRWQAEAVGEPLLEVLRR